MDEQLTGPCCVLCAAMNYNDAPDRRDEPNDDRFNAIVAVIAALGFIVLFLV
jgi:hypothetical protein